MDYWGKEYKMNAYMYMCKSVQFSHSVVSTLCDPKDCSTPGIHVHHQLPEFTQTHVHWVSDVIQPFHPLSSPSPPDFNLSQHQGLFKCVSSSHQVAKILEFQLQHQSFQWTSILHIHIHMHICINDSIQLAILLKLTQLCKSVIRQ